MNWKERRELIANLLKNKVVANQDALRTHLGKRGVAVSQASLSRDLKAMGVQRVRRADGVFAYALPTEPPPATSARSFRSRFATSVTGVRRSAFVVLIFTPPGEAQLVGRLLDQVTLRGLLGTVAGDDTIICVAADVPAARELEKEFNMMLD